MPRRDEPFIIGQVHHLYNRGVNRNRIFSTAENYNYLLRQVKAVLAEVPASIFAYCLMPNHYHFVIRQEGDVPLSDFIGRLFKRYSQAYNQQEKRAGPLFASRFRNIPVDTDEYLIHLARYVHLNPVTAGLCRRPEEWLYSNYLEWIGQRNGTLVNRAWIRDYFPTPQAYINFVHTDPPSQLIEKLQRYLLE